MGRRGSLQSRSKAAQYRHSPEGRMARHFYEQRPEVQLRKSIKRAMKHGKSPSAVVLDMSRMYKPYKPSMH